MYTLLKGTRILNMKRATTIQCDREDCLRSADSVLKQCWTMSVPGCWASLANPEVEWSAVGDFVYNITITNYWIDHSYILYILYYHIVITLFYTLLHCTLLHFITISLLHIIASYLHHSYIIIVLLVCHYYTWQTCNNGIIITFHQLISVAYS